MTGPTLIFGGRGLVGDALQAEAGDAEALALGRADADITDRAQVARTLDEHRPAAVINCAVFQPVDLCETHPEDAFRVNAIAAGSLAEECAEREIRMVQVSTDYVFRGDQRQPYTESACPFPLSVYAASKLAGEHLVLAASDAHAVVRTSSVFGPIREGHGTAPFVERMLQRALAGQPTRVVDDQVVSPTLSTALARSLWSLAARDEGGIFHAGGDGACSWYELARVIFAAAGRPELLGRTTAAQFGAPARRPAFSALAPDRLRSLGLPVPPSWEQTVPEFLARYHPELGTGRHE